LYEINDKSDSHFSLIHISFEGQLHQDFFQHLLQRNNFPLIVKNNLDETGNYVITDFRVLSGFVGSVDEQKEWLDVVLHELKGNV
jgi:hypothetical protein